MSRTRKREIVKRKRNKEKKQKKKIDIHFSKVYIYFGGKTLIFSPIQMMKLLIKKMSYRMLADMASIPVKKPATTIWREIGLLVSADFSKKSADLNHVSSRVADFFDAIFLFYFKK